MIQAIVSFPWSLLIEKNLYTIVVRVRGLEWEPKSGQVEVSYTQEHLFILGAWGSRFSSFSFVPSALLCLFLFSLKRFISFHQSLS